MAIEDLVTKADLARFIRQQGTASPSLARVKPPTYLTADIPAAADHEGEVIYVSDGGAGAEFQGSNGTAWVNLG